MWKGENSMRRIKFDWMCAGKRRHYVCVDMVIDSQTRYLQIGTTYVYVVRICQMCILILCQTLQLSYLFIYYEWNEKSHCINHQIARKVIATTPWTHFYLDFSFRSLVLPPLGRRRCHFVISTHIDATQKWQMQDEFSSFSLFCFRLASTTNWFCTSNDLWFCDFDFYWIVIDCVSQNEWNERK